MSNTREPEQAVAEPRGLPQETESPGIEYVDALARRNVAAAADSVFAWVERGFGRELRQRMLEAGVDLGVPITGWLDQRGGEVRYLESGAARLLLLVGQEPIEVEHIEPIGEGGSRRRRRVADAAALIAAAPLWTVMRAAADIERGRVLWSVVAGLGELRAAK